MTSPDWLYWLLGGVLVTGGLALLAWSLFAGRSRGRRRCPKCWYDMTGASPLACDLHTRAPRLFRCTECGRLARTERSLHRTRRRWGWALAACIVLLGGALVATWPNGSRDGWDSFVPAPLLLICLSPFDAHGEAMYEQLTSGSIRVSPSAGRWERLLIARQCVLVLRQTSPRSAEDEGWNTPLRRAMLVLAQLRPEARLARDDIVDLLGAEDDITSMMSTSACRALSADPGIISALESILNRRRSAPRTLSALRALGALDPPRGMDWLDRLVLDPDAGTRHAAVNAIGDWADPFADRLGTILFRHLSDVNGAVSEAAADHLLRVDDTYVEKFAAMIGDQRNPLRRVSLQAVAEWAREKRRLPRTPADISRVRAVIQAIDDARMKDPSPLSRCLFCLWLLSIDPSAPESTAALQAARAESDPTVRDDMRERLRSSRMLWLWWAPGEAWSEPDHRERCAMLDSMGEHVRAAHPYIGRVIDIMLSDPVQAVRCHAARTLGVIGRGSTEAVEALRSAAESDDAVLADLAREALGKLEPDPAPATPGGP